MTISAVDFQKIYTIVEMLFTHIYLSKARSLYTLGRYNF
jgi:hypothetical protein